ncbi:cytochrome P450 [Lentinula aciculospora]|uniref:Cytochrome P450 n=1 Tax=Lentinula aciculospora TaxID=153920 RepID=A0A9W9DQH4_9AGAR|nr:cytochrome P450 [Lentinula aciculospora]
MLSDIVSPLPTQFLIVVSLAYVAYHYSGLSPHQRRFPPGPKPAFIIGFNRSSISSQILLTNKLYRNALQIPSISPQETFAKWLHEYGDVVYLKLFQQSLVVLNSLDAAQNLLHQRSSIYSDRPNFVLFNDLMGWQNASTHVRYGPRFRRHRRFIHQTFNQRAVETLRGVQEKEICHLIQGLMDEPEQVTQHLRRFVAATIMKVTYGIDVKTKDDLVVQLAHRAGSLTVRSGTPAAMLVDYIPVMKYIPTWAPFAGFKRNARIVKEAVDSMFNIPYEMVKSQMASGTVFPCMTSRLMKACSPAGVHCLSSDVEEDIKGVAGTMYAAAEDTTLCILTTFILAMVLHPQVFKKAQNEMDNVIGMDRLPSFEDRSSLPYLECVLKEVCRWNVPVPLGLPHRLMDDDMYKDYHIPKGTTVMANIHCMLQNCSQPQVFHPERYIEDPNLIDPGDVIYGFGRRRCPGRHFGDRSVWLAAASIICTMVISKAKDDAGKELTPKATFIDGFVHHPAEFPCSVRPRSEKLSMMTACTDMDPY